MGGVSDVMADNITDIGGEGREAQTQDTTSRSTAACNGCRVRKQKVRLDSLMHVIAYKNKQRQYSTFLSIISLIDLSWT